MIAMFDGKLALNSKGCEAYADMLADMAIRLDMAVDDLEEKNKLLAEAAETLTRVKVTMEGYKHIR